MIDEILKKKIDKYNKKIKNSSVLGITWFGFALFIVNKLGFAYETEGHIRFLMYVFSIYSLIKCLILIRKKRKVEEEREQKKREKQLAEEKKEKEKKEKIEKYEIERRDKEKKYIEYLIENPNALLLYKEIMSKGREYNSINKNDFKTLFWNFLTRTELNGKIEFKFEQQKFFDEIASFFEYNYIWIDQIKMANSRVDIWLESINNFKNLFQFFEQYYENTVKEFEKNEDLMEIYNNLKKEECDKEYIQKKLNYLYDNLYSSNNVKFSREDIDLIINLEDNIFEIKSCNIQIDTIKSKKQLIEIFSDKYNNLDERKMIICIINMLQTKNDINIKLKSDIVKNIDDILEKIMLTIKKIKLKKKIIKEKNLQRRKEIDY